MNSSPEPRSSSVAHTPTDPAPDAGSPRPRALTRREAIGTALTAGAGVVLAKAAVAAAAAPATAPATPPLADFVDRMVPGAAGPGQPAVGYGAQVVKTPLKAIPIKRREIGPQDVQIDVLYAGVCHSDIHQVENDWKNTNYPCVPGHEVVGRVSAVGAGVTEHKAGDVVGVGTMVDSCRQCKACQAGLENYCEGPHGHTATYNGPAKPDGTNTYGGYSNRLVVPDHFVFQVPPTLDLKGVPSLLCAGITTYSPLRHWKVRPGHKVGVVGMGGLGHTAVKLAAVMGAEVTVFSTSPDKEADARAFGAREFVLSKDTAAMKAREMTQDLILSTVPEPHDVNPFVKLLARDGTLVVVGLLAPFAAGTDNGEVAMHRRSVAGSLIGGVPETKEMLAFCAEHRITPAVQLIAMPEINDAFLRVKAGKVRYRYVIDIANTLKPA